MNFHREDHLRPMINMINGINPSYAVYPIRTVPGREERVMTHLTYCRPYLSRRTTVTLDGIKDGIIFILIAWIAYAPPETRLNGTRHLELNRTLANSRFSLSQPLERTIIILIMVLHKPTTRVTVVLWDYLHSEYPKPLRTMGYGTPSNTIIQYCSSVFANL
jgi:hypothetical protein